MPVFGGRGTSAQTPSASKTPEEQRFSNQGNRAKCRLTESALKPYIVMKGINDGLVKGTLLEGICGPERPPNTSLWDGYD